MQEENKNLQDYTSNALNTIEAYLASIYPIDKKEYSQNIRSTSFLSALNYTLLAGGKRIRPLLCILLAEISAYKTNTLFNKNDILPIAAAIEMIHTYSLVHDDLPAMDNDDLRRGKPTCHKAYDEATAILAGDALLTDAFNLCTKANFPAENILKAITFLSKCAGSEGMIAGQILDLAMEKKSLHTSDNDELKLLQEMNSRKTGDLLLASCYLPTILYNTDSLFANECKEFAINFGIAFQITDDILDIIGDAKIMGKPQGSDLALEKTTWVSLLGLDEARNKALVYIDTSQKILDGWKSAAMHKNETALHCIEILTNLLQSLTKRTK